MLPATQTQYWLPKTKFIPPTQHASIPRPQLVASLQDQLLAHKLTLVSAPAGSGKTTTIANLVTALPSLPFAWLALDEMDNDPGTFMAAIVMALHTAGAVSDSLLELIDESVGDKLNRLMTLLINDILENTDEHFVLVVDDLHLIENQSIMTALDFLLERLPERMHILIATRYDPPLSLARLRAQGQLGEFRLEALRFDMNEIGQLFNQELHLQLDERELATIQASTEGWVAGLRLIGLSLSQMEPDLRQERLEQLSRSNQHVFDLLADEVLHQQSVELVEFLLKTSILEDLTPKLCNAVTGRDDSARILRDLYGRNLFLRSTSSADHAYRYHDLFTAFLRQELQTQFPRQVKELHFRAAEAHIAPRRKIHHFIAAEAWDEAATIIAEVGRDMVNSGSKTIVRDWVEQLPPDVQKNYPWLQLIIASIATFDGEFDRAMQLAKSAEATFRQQNNSEGIVEAIFTHYSADDDNDDLAGMEVFVEAITPYPLNDYQKLRFELMQAWVYLFEVQLEPSQAHFREVFRTARRIPERWSSLGQDIAASMLIGFDDYTWLEHELQAIVEEIGNRPSLMLASALSVLAQIALWRGELATTRDLIADCAEAWEQVGGVHFVAEQVLRWQQAIHAWIQQDYQAVDKITHCPPETFNENRHLANLRGRLAWWQNDMESVQEILRMLQSFDEMKDDLGGPIYRAQVEVWELIHEEQYEQAEAMLMTYIPKQQVYTHFYSMYCVDLRPTLAYLYYRWKMPDEALRILSEVCREYERPDTPGRLAQEGHYLIPLLELAIQQGVHTDFVQRTLDILQADTTPKPIRIEATGETLTSREVEVLRMIVDGATNRDIADAYFISMSTVKTHVSRVLQKLDVSNRTQAVAKVRELRIM